MSKSRIKKLRKQFEEEYFKFSDLTPLDKLSDSPKYKYYWKRFKKNFTNK